jgi:hypothetical protein
MNLSPTADTTLLGRHSVNVTWKNAVMNNSTLSAADRTTHAKIVAVSLAASVAVGLVGMMARSPAADANARTQVAGPAVKAGKPVVVSHSEITAIR